MRLVRPADFTSVFQAPRRSSDRFFTVLSRATPHDHPRLGIVTPRRNVRTAVGRHRLKRIVRESFRIHQHALPPVDLVVLPRPGVDRLDSLVLRRSLAHHWHRVARPCSVPSSP